MRSANVEMIILGHGNQYGAIAPTAGPIDGVAAGSAVSDEVMRLI